MSVYNLLLGISDAKKPSREFISSSEENVSRTTYNFTTPDWGAGTTKTLIILTFARAAAASRTQTAPTLGGQTTTLRASANTTTGGFLTRVAIYSLDVTSDPATTAIVMGFSGSMVRAGFSLYSLYNITSSTPATSATAQNSSTLSVTLTSLQADDAVLALAYDQNGGSTTWTGVIEDIENTYGSSGSTLVTSSGNLGVSATVSVSTYSALIAAAWR